MPDITMKRERTDRWIKMRLSRARSSKPAASSHMLSSVDCITQLRPSLSFGTHRTHPPPRLVARPSQERLESASELVFPIRYCTYHGRPSNRPTTHESHTPIMRKNMPK